MGKLDGKVAVITGGTSGMARAGAKLFVDEGAHVFISGRWKDALDEAVKLIGRNVTGVQADSADLNDLDRLFETVKQEKGAVPLFNDGGSIFMTGSNGSLRGYPNWSVYAASKAVLPAYARVWVSELRDRKIRVNVQWHGARCRRRYHSDLSAAPVSSASRAGRGSARRARVATRTPN
jgi:NAD(P)-dependent dehydrogenase (short-subunit alcohol dehydrogenase family)